MLMPDGLGNTSEACTSALFKVIGLCSAVLNASVEAAGTASCCQCSCFIFVQEVSNDGDNVHFV